MLPIIGHRELSASRSTNAGVFRLRRGDDYGMEPGCEMAIGKLHLLVLHFPIALILAAGLADLLWLIWRTEKL